MKNTSMPEPWNRGPWNPDVTEGDLAVGIREGYDISESEMSEQVEAAVARGDCRDDAQSRRNWAWDVLIRGDYELEQRDR